MTSEVYIENRSQNVYQFVVEMLSAIRKLMIL